MHHRLRVVAAVSVVAAVLLVPALPAQAKNVSIKTWSAGFCKAFAGWQSTAMKAHTLVEDVITNGVPSSAKAKAARTKIVSALDAASKKASSTAKTIEGLGTPKITNGAKISSTLSSAIDQTSSTFANAKDDVSGAPTDPKKFQSTIKTITTKVDGELNQAGTNFNKVSTLDTDGALTKAFAATPSCVYLNGGSSGNANSSSAS